MINLAEKFNVVIKTTAAESPWSNGLCERHNALITSNIHKVRLDVGCSVQMALAWSLSAKNCLANVHGFSPNQLVFSKNPNFPNILDNKVPANNVECTSKVLERHLNALHTARQEFVKSEASEKIKRALSRKTRSYSDHIYCTGDIVYYKRLRSDQWHGSAKLLGKDGQVCLLKHGGFYIRVHPCRMSPVNSDAASTSLNDNSALSTDYSKIDDIFDSQNAKSAKDFSHLEDSTDDDSLSNSTDPSVSDTDLSDPFSNSDFEIETTDGGTRSSEMDHNNTHTERITNSSEVPVINAPIDSNISYKGPVGSAKDLPKMKQRIAYKTSTHSDWNVGTVLSRGGKVGGIHWHFLNIQPEGSDKVNSVSFRDDIVHWKEVLTNEDENETANFVYIWKACK